MSKQAFIRGTRVLLAEDNALVGLMVADGLEDHGFECVAHVTSVTEGNTWLDLNDVDCAVVDYRLADGSCEELLAKLEAKGIPFVMLSGLRRPASFRYDVPWLEKPCSMAMLAQTLTAAFIGDWSGASTVTVGLGALVAHTSRIDRAVGASV